MVVTRTNDADPQPPNDFEGGGFFNRLNRRLFPYLGPPPLGPYDEAPVPDAAAAACPVCGSQMADHRFDRTGSGPTKLYCP